MNTAIMLAPILWGCVSCALTTASGGPTGSEPGSELGNDQGNKLIEQESAAPPAVSAIEERVQQPDALRRAADKAIAFDFANAIVQLVNASSTSLRFEHDAYTSSTVTDTLEDILVQSGYRKARSGDEARLVKQSVLALENGLAYRHDITVGDIGLRRAYRTAAGKGTVPVSSLYVKGADARAIQMIDDWLFSPPIPGEQAASLSVDEFLSLLPPELALASWSNEPDLIAEHMIQFLPGSNELDQQDISLIDDIVARFNTATDTISITGYADSGSNDEPATQGDVRDLALSRAERIHSAFTTVGVPAERIVMQTPVGEGYIDESLAQRAELRLTRQSEGVARTPGADL